MTSARLLASLSGTLLALLLLAAPSAGNWQSYLLVYDAQGDLIEGETLLPDQSAFGMLALELHHLVTTDEGTVPAYHKPLVVTRRMDKTSSRIFQAFAEDERLRVVVRTFWLGNALWEIELDQARIVALEPITQEINSEPWELERLRFIYRGIIVRDLSGPTAMTWTLAGWPR